MYKLAQRLPLVLVIIPCLIYLPFLRNQLVWDDEQFIYNNAYVREFRIPELLTQNTIAGAGENSNYYRPLTSLSFALDYQVWGLNPIGYHLTNLVLHTTAGLLLFQLLVTLGLSQRASFWLSAAFLAHPVQTEAVTYANSRGDSMYAVFGLLSVLLFLWLLKKRSLKVQLYNLSFELRPWFFALASVSSYILSILGKEIGIAVAGLHAAIFLYEFCLQKKPMLWVRGQLLALGNLFSIATVAASYLLLRATLLNFSNSFNFYGDTASIYAQSLWVRMLTFGKILLIYMRILVFPYPLHMERTTTIVESVASPWPWIAASVLIGVAVLGWFEWRRLQSLYIWLGLAWAAALLAPVSGIIPINGLLYEHWLYLPLVGFGLVGYGLLRLLRLKLPALVPIVVLAVWVVLSWRQNYIWSTPERLYTHILKYAETGRVHNNLAMAYAAQGKHEQALQQYQAALRISDHYPQIYHNMANTYGAQKKWDEAITHYQKAIDLAPQFEPAYFRLLLVHAQLEQWHQAEEVLQAWHAVAGDTPDVQQASDFITTQKTLRKSTE